MKNAWKSIGGIILIFLILSVIFSAFDLQKQKPETVSVQTLVTQINEGNVQKLEIDGDEKIVVTLADNTEQVVRKEPIQPYDELLLNFGVTPEQLNKLNIVVKEESGTSVWLIPLLQFMVPFLLIIGFIYFMTRQVQGANKNALSFGQSRAR
ncbi:MAG TPA: ATP-dependent metallopeptidase FtsH/Yme1/Tma family protein [Patescibacteria group bacterium]|nr:ATP-dependent metallopeptidase FtsH/Yme1/Tma family protein [Patescibacteria group bacterium]